MTTAISAADELVAFDPHWCLFWGERVPVTQFEIWRPYVTRSRYRFVVMSGEDIVPDSIRARIEQLPNCAVLELNEEARTWIKSVRSFRGFLYVTSKPGNFRTVNSFGGAAHVWLGHGDSEKKANAFRTVSLYDAVLMARYSNVKRFPRAVRRWVWHAACAIGTPIVDGAVRDPWTRPHPVRTILYAPTWEGYSDPVDYSSLPEVAPRLAAAMPGLRERGVRVVMRAHPATGNRLADRRGLLDTLVKAGVERGTAKADDFAAADLMISDISGVTGEFLFTEKPTVLPVSTRLESIGKDRRSVSRDYPWVYLWDADRDPLAPLLEEIETRDALATARASAARAMFRGHRSLEDAVRTFDTALSVTRWRKINVPLRFVFEVKVRFPRLVAIGGRIARGLRRRRPAVAPAPTTPS